MLPEDRHIVRGQQKTAEGELNKVVTQPLNGDSSISPTLNPPADCPNIVTFSGSPPNLQFVITEVY